MKMRALMFLAATLTLAGCVPNNNTTRKFNRLNNLRILNATYQQLNPNLQSEVAANQVQIKQLQNRLVVTMVNSILFPEGGWELHQQGRQQLTKVMPALQGLTGNRLSFKASPITCRSNCR